MSSPLVPAPGREVVSPTAAADTPEVPAPQTLVCANCDAPLAGEYCSRCGQRHEPHVHHLSHFAGEAFESITHADSRLWRTLGYLLVKPGRLTKEFFSGRRARQLPPFRLYLVVSLLFFLIAGTSRSIDIEADNDDKPATPESVAALNSAADSLESQLGKPPGLETTIQKLREQAAQQQAELDAAKAGAKPATDGDGDEARPAKREKKEHSDRVQSDMCRGVVDPGPGGGWTGRAMFSWCQKVNKMSGKALLEEMAHNIPKAMFVFLPLLAGFMKLLYWRPKRYYVEHLLFLVHNHAFVFVAMAIMILVPSVPYISRVTGWLETVLSLYIIYYIFRAMRVYYGQSRTLTFGKYVVIFFAYIATSVIVLAGTALYSTLIL